MTIGEKFTTATDFVLYLENTFGIDLVDAMVEEYYHTHLDNKFTYTGVLKDVKALGTTV